MDISFLLGQVLSWGFIICMVAFVVAFYLGIFECWPIVTFEEKERRRLEREARALARQRYEDSMDEKTKALKDLLVFVKKGTIPTPLFDAALAELQARNMCQVVQEE